MVMTALIGHVIGKYVSCVSNWTVRTIARTLLNELKVRQGNQKIGNKTSCPIDNL